MWPWEHLAVGYLVYSLLVHLTDGRAPAAGGAIAVGLGTQFPDLVDKPLGWGTAILPSGPSLAHSLVFALPCILGVGIVAVALDRTDLGAAFGIGYLSHLPGDVVYPVLLGGDLNLSFLFWPVTSASGSQPTAMFAYVQELFAQFTAVLATPQGAFYLAFEALLILGTLVIWFFDGAPGLPRRTTTAQGDLS